MNSFQRVIKYCAMAFAIFLTVMIISGIASIAFAVVSFMPGGSVYTSVKWNNKTVDYQKSFTDVRSLEINHKIGELYIKTGEEFKVEGENVSENFKAVVDDNGKLTISYNNSSFPWFHIKNLDRPNTRVTLYVPADFVAEKAKIDTGAGNLTIEGLKSDNLEISAGAGNISGHDITAENADIEGGLGNINFKNVNFSDAELECGVGNMNINGVLAGNTDLESGVGEVTLDLIGNVNDYSFNVDSGIGNIRVNGEKISEKHWYNSGADNTITVDGGIGNVNIELREE